MLFPGGKFMKFKKLFCNGKQKAATFSFDDGTVQDIKVIEIFRKYGIKGTFNLNSGIMNEDGCWMNGEQVVKRLFKDEVCHCYDGFEIAVHGRRHIRLDEATKMELFDELVLDRVGLEAIAGYPVQGMVSAFGSYDDDILEFVKKCGIVYNRGIHHTYDFEVPSDFFEWNPTCHYAEENIHQLLEKFLKSDEGFKLLYLWGHSYELDCLDNWDHFEGICQTLNKCDDIWFATNMEIYRYVTAMNQLVFAEDDRCIYNPSEVDVWIEINEIVYCLKSRTATFL